MFDNIRNLTGIYLRGFCMGAADAVPGVSGGTIALITGIYDRLIRALTNFGPADVRQILDGVRTTQWDKTITALQDTDLGFLMALGAGILTASISILRVMSTLLETNPIETYGFFFGLIAASAVLLYQDVSLATRGRQAAAVIGFFLAVAISGSVSTSPNSSLPLLFLAGAIAITAMILPGLSGSLLLLLLGQYEYLSQTLRQFTDTLWATLDGSESGSIIAQGIPLGVFLMGSIFGLLTTSHLVRLALENYREATMAFLVSLILGSLRAPIEQVNAEVNGNVWTTETIGLFVAFGIIGSLLVLFLNRLASSTGTTQATHKTAS